ncbi:fasciclin domain-containing protein [Mucilaginibacter sp. UR6-1]|uniref:fasciclin domain-containing protein n=1 Tax=Mucilaginibacter sp. UR6-1 TaxID=1435643 RepID=UPI001E2CD909|nr:fasciclin domain-containing protein [Mucilaginibacter sp. UR6-1]MCC8409198.1 fasciclin domain-containing protein [Mucilaginibacter sp. UR6-1]
MRFKILVVLMLVAAQMGFAQTAPVTSKSIEGSIMVSNKTAFDNLKFAPNFSVFINLVEQAGLKSTLTAAKPITVLAPTNKAFEGLPAGILDTLRKPENKAALINYVKGYIIQGKLTSADISRLINTGNGQAKLTTITPTTLLAKVNTNRNVTLTDAFGLQTIISRYDIMTSNAVLHTLTAALSVSLPIPLNIK